MSTSSRPALRRTGAKARWSTAKKTKAKARTQAKAGRRRGAAERPERTERASRAERPERAQRPVRAERPERRDRPSRSSRPERQPRAEGRERTQRPERTQRQERLQRQERAAEVREPVTPVAADNGFAALGVPAPLVQRLARDSITAPFPIQSATIPDALAGRDVLGRGQTGSGKTLSFGLPLLARLAEGRAAGTKRPRALVLTPTRELAMQVSDALQPLVHVLGLRHKLVAGGMPYTPQLQALEKGVDLLIATPGRLIDLLERGAVLLDRVEVAVLDEADHMADMGFLPDVTTILDQVPAGGQRLLFSATLDRGVDGVVERYLTDPVTHSTDAATASVATMEHRVLLIDPAHKKALTAELANREGRTVIFARTKLGADRIAGQLREQGVLAAALHGGLGQGARNRVLAAFRDGDLPVLVATDVAARGIHVDDVALVLQVDPPADHKDYLHRAGRTARAGERGTVVTLALPHQRRLMERMADAAGLDGVRPVRARPGDDLVAAIGGGAPSGVAVPEQTFRRLLERPTRPGPRRGGPGRGGPRRGGPRGRGQGQGAGGARHTAPARGRRHSGAPTG